MPDQRRAPRARPRAADRQRAAGPRRAAPRRRHGGPRLLLALSPSGSSFSDRLRRVGYARRAPGRAARRSPGARHPALAGVACQRGCTVRRTARSCSARPIARRHRHRGRLAAPRGRERHLRRRVRPPTLLSTRLRRLPHYSPQLHRLSAREPEDPGPARHLRRARRRRARAHGARGACPPHPRARGLCAHRDPHLRGDRAVRARGGGVHRRRAEGDVHARRGPERVADPAARGHRAGLPRLPRARDAQAPAAGEALVPVELLPPRASAGRALPPVLAGRRGGDRLRRPRASTPR